MAETVQAAWKVSYRNISPKMKKKNNECSLMYGSPFPPYKKTNHLGIIIMGLKYDKTIILILFVTVTCFKVKKGDDDVTFM